jgi:uncharacterized SAM-dependent methyltransferase
VRLANDAILTEHCYKYSLAEVDRLAQATRLCRARTWFDANELFSLNLLEPA